MKKIVINNCYGGFGLSPKASIKLQELGASSKIKRDDPLLVKVVEELGEEASARYANLIIIEIPEDAEWQIEEYDGIEWVAEKHRTWGK